MKKINVFEWVHRQKRTRQKRAVKSALTKARTSKAYTSKARRALLHYLSWFIQRICDTVADVRFHFFSFVSSLIRRVTMLRYVDCITIFVAFNATTVSTNNASP